MACEKKHNKTDLIVKDLPINQGGLGRHKCASCAYEKGVDNGKKHVKDFDIENFIKTLPESQKGLRRHRDPIEAYDLGYFHGQIEASKNLTIKDKRGIAFTMRNFGLSLIAKGILGALKKDDLPYLHAMGVISVANGFEILIKARIVEEHPLLIFDKISKNDKKMDDNLEFNDLLENGRTIEYSKLPYQLWATTGYKIENKELYKKFGFIRNQIIHFHVPMDITLTDLIFEYVFKIIEPSIDNWWQKTVLQYIKVFDRSSYKQLFDKINTMNLPCNYTFADKSGYIKR
jgi:hypothetical protein